MIEYMRSEAQKKADMKSRQKIYVQITLQTRRENVLNDRIKLCANKLNMSKNAFLLYAIEKELLANGYGLETVHAIQTPDTDTD